MATKRLENTTHFESDVAAGARNTNANFVLLSGSTTGQPVVVQPEGDDTNVNLRLVGKGTGGVQVGSGGTVIKNILAGAVSVDPPAQAAAGFFTMTVTITGAATGDVIFLHPPSTLETTLRLVGYNITAANTVTLLMEATGAVDGAARSWDYLLVDLT